MILKSSGLSIGKVVYLLYTVFLVWIVSLGVPGILKANAVVGGMMSILFYFSVVRGICWFFNTMRSSIEIREQDVMVRTSGSVIYYKYEDIRSAKYCRSKLPGNYVEIKFKDNYVYKVHELDTNFKKFVKMTEHKIGPFIRKSLSTEFMNSVKKEAN